MTSILPYTHWAYFSNQDSARRCADELADYVTRVRRSAWDEMEWLLLAGRDVEIDHLVVRHGEVEEIVTRHGGYYDGGEASYLEGAPVADPTLTESGGAPT